MHKFIRLAVVLAVMALLLATAAPALAAPPDKVECYVQPVIGGPDDPDVKRNGPATVFIPVNNPAIRWNDEPKIPGKVFLPVDGTGGAIG